jgi:hypothetical protein
MIEAAAIVSAIIGHWDDFVIITGLLLFNAALEFWQEVATNACGYLRHPPEVPCGKGRGDERRQAPNERGR